MAHGDGTILDRILARLYPEGAFGGLLPPEQLAQERGQALSRAGFSLLAGAGPQPVGTRNTGADIARAFNPDAWREQLSGAAQAASSISELQQEATRDALAEEVIARHPVQPGANQQEQARRLRALAADFTAVGLWEHAKMAGDLLEDVLRGAPADPTFTIREGIDTRGPGFFHLPDAPGGEATRIPGVAPAIVGPESGLERVDLGDRIVWYDSRFNVVHEVGKASPIPGGPVIGQSVLRDLTELRKQAPPDFVTWRAYQFDVTRGAVPAEDQQYISAVQRVSANIVRMLSGAQASEQEVKRVRENFLPAPGDKPPTVDRKLMQLESLAEALARGQTPAEAIAAAEGRSTPSGVPRGRRPFDDFLEKP